MTNLQLEQASKESTYRKGLDAREGFVTGALWHESLPLADRLTESEKEKIRKEYKKAHSEAFAETTCLDRQYARGRYQVLRETFGKTLFNPTEQ